MKYILLALLLTGCGGGTDEKAQALLDYQKLCISEGGISTVSIGFNPLGGTGSSSCEFTALVTQ